MIQQNLTLQALGAETPILVPVEAFPRLGGALGHVEQAWPLRLRILVVLCDIRRGSEGLTSILSLLAGPMPLLL